MHTYISVVVIGSQSQFCTRNILCVGSTAIHMNVNAGKVSIVTVVPYSGFLSRMKTFANFAFLWRFAKVLSAKTNLDHCDMPSTS